MADLMPNRRVVSLKLWNRTLYLYGNDYSQFILFQLYSNNTYILDVLQTQKHFNLATHFE